MSALASEHADQVRQRILEGAARAFARAGLRATSVPAIATESGVSVGLIYRYFTGKDELYAAACMRGAESEMEGLRARMASISDPRARLEHALDFYLARLGGDDEANLLLGAMAEARRSPALGAALRARRQTIRAFVGAFLEERVAEGTLQPPTGPLAHAVALTLDGAVVETAMGGSEPELTREAILALLSRLLQPA